MLTDNTLYLFQNIDGYRYSSDSLILCDFISKLNPREMVLDIGSGSGILGLLLKRDFPSISLTQIDIEPLHVELTRKSAEYNGLDSEILFGDIREYKFESRFDFIVANPPYYNAGSQKSKNEILRVSRYADALPFDELCRAVSSIMNPKGEFAFCYDAKQVDSVLSVLLKNRFKANLMRFVHPKKDKEASLVLICAKKSSKSLCKILPTLYMDSEETGQIYRKLNTKEVKKQC